MRRLSRAFGFEIGRLYPADFDAGDLATIARVAPYTMTSPAAIQALRTAVKYVVANRIEGAFVECGVWRGGSMMAIAHTLLELGTTDHELFLFDTFEGMTSPTERDVWQPTGERASDLLARRSHGSHIRAVAQLAGVRSVMRSVGYDDARIHLVEGRVEDTLPARAPERISLLRLDTDWYDSTKHELVHLFPRLSRGGVLIVDDYGVWRGARQAVDEYLRENQVPLLLNRVDPNGVRIAVKI
ncbi:MAG: TylF/MycF/NovP-related O-methyltransferase [Candidatus Limnocylindria bacterium]